MTGLQGGPLPVLRIGLAGRLQVAPPGVDVPQADIGGGQGSIQFGRLVVLGDRLLEPLRLLVSIGQVVVDPGEDLAVLAGKGERLLEEPLFL